MRVVGGNGMTPEEAAARQRRYGSPDNEAPVALPWSAVLGRSEDLAVLLVGASASSAGVLLQVAVRARQVPEHAHDLHAAVSGHRVGAHADDRLLLGVEFADGRTTTNVTGMVARPPADPDAPALQSRGSGGGGRSVDTSLFLSPLPPPGPLTIVCAWPAQEIAETRTELDGAELLAAAGRVEELWPWEPEQQRGGWEAAPPPRIPDGGWFARALGR